MFHWFIKPGDDCAAVFPKMLVWLRGWGGMLGNSNEPISWRKREHLWSGVWLNHLSQTGLRLHDVWKQDKCWRNKRAGILSKFKNVVKWISGSVNLRSGLSFSWIRTNSFLCDKCGMKTEFPWNQRHADFEDLLPRNSTVTQQKNIIGFE